MKKSGIIFGAILGSIILVVLTIFLLTPSKTNKQEAKKMTDNTVQTTKQKDKASKVTTKESKATNKEMNLDTEQNPVTTKEEAKAEGPTNTDKSLSTINLEAISNGDFSSIAGTWENYSGQGIIFDNKGVVAIIYYNDDGKKIVNDTYDIQISRIENNILKAGIYSRESLIGGASLAIVPTGTKTSGEKLIYEQDAILIGQSSKAEYEPYYKVSDDTTAPESVVTTEEFDQEDE
ncbi:DUF6287 domain-containing protein [Streptococcus zalophi]|uniref:DUF6287 domain-containing protein n=1 Tax=Streptococcus zalophi TaxID=640031 RepID=A0A934UCP7_9STRE|nr:DUF6287 domain-containing protein [Streptococcus zalophi]MBJ8349067.1 hypothetical protein [Streptococcus zalophi]MCR8967782.1 DUF6287 domain-containing protein [Streptococcus zalophi]